MGYRLGVDVGGTFTDVLLVDERTGVSHRAKTASTPADQSEGVLDGIRKVCRDAGIEMHEDRARAELRRLGGAGIEALTVSPINSYANDAHERRVAELAAEELPGVPVSLSSHVLPELREMREMREYERTVTTVANSYVQPEVSRYVGNLDRSLSGSGIDAPLSLLLSGPAGEVTGAVWFARTVTATRRLQS
ncbi:hydantoinase/oxoprolinase N-terminal domain-containing protein [Actinomadura mexicana]|uniref:Hydantoinase/oxoprolinase N-terminal region n=1 Tax=Actinomadura mexicana TaxID=134959 RepID=A0A239GPV4_9ACTN|nr:hydantoinase/oxoprolinase N-terminal domain-containing protein [Actinomadura mexicana]SNS71160.1 Hydantoinase/oxoprolinase N-terminal region [Actinomadura mexicana]